MNLVSFKTPILRVAITAVLAFALLALPIPLPGKTASAASQPASALIWSQGAKIQLQMGYSLASQSNQQPNLSAFDVQVDGVRIAVTSLDYSLNLFLYLVLATPIYRGTTATVTYTAPTSDPTTNNAALQRTTGDDTESFSFTLNTAFGAPTTTTTTIAPSPGGSGLNSSGLPSWDTEPLTDSETDAFTEGIWPSVIPGNIIITNEFGFTVDKKNGIKPRIRMKNYAGKITKMTLSATYKDGSKTKKYKCVYADFGSTKKVKTAKWKWYTPKKACVLPAPLVASIQKGTATLSAKGKWSRQWVTSAKKTRPDKTKIKARTLRYTVKGVPR